MILPYLYLENYDLPLPDIRKILPYLILGSFVWSIFPTSHTRILLTGSKEYFPYKYYNGI